MGGCDNEMDEQVYDYIIDGGKVFGLYLKSGSGVLRYCKIARATLSLLTWPLEETLSYIMRLAVLMFGSGLRVFS